MTSKPKILVLGGKGFIGRHAIHSLSRLNIQVSVGTRRPQDSTGSSEVGVVLHEMTKETDWTNLIDSFDVVLNSVGILRQRSGESYEAVHIHAPAAIASACANAGKRYVHVSAVGLRAEAVSRFNTSKLLGEQAVAAAGGDYRIVRISLIDGEGGFGATWLRGVAKLPFFVVPDSATGRIAALTADDAGEALAKLCLEEGERKNKNVDLGGEEYYLFEEYIRGLRRRHTTRSALAIRLPGLVTRIAAHLFDVIHFSPFSFGHWEMLCHDNIPRSADLRDVLGRDPTKVIDRVEEVR